MRPAPVPRMAESHTPGAWRSTVTGRLPLIETMPARYTTRLLPSFRRKVAKSSSHCNTTGRSCRRRAFTLARRSA